MTLADYPEGGEAQIAETSSAVAAGRAPHTSGRRTGRAVARLALLRSRPTAPSRCWWPRASIASTPSSSSHPRSQRPSARALPFRPDAANSAWTVIAALAHNLGRWTTLIGLPNQAVQVAAADATGCSRSQAGWHAAAGDGRYGLPARWPWQTEFTTVLHRLRALPTLT